MSKILWSCEWLTVRGAEYLNRGVILLSDGTVRALRLAECCFEARRRRDGEGTESVLDE